jgi:predicted alternative tryptophan synthase beta-subunit
LLTVGTEAFAGQALDQVDLGDATATWGCRVFTEPIGKVIIQRKLGVVPAVISSHALSIVMGEAEAQLETGNLSTDFHDGALRVRKRTPM